MTGPARVIAALLLALLPTDCWGFGGQVIELPVAVSPNAAPKQFSPLSGYSVSVDTRWFGAGGYRPVRVRFERATAAKTEQVLGIDVRLRMSNRSPQTHTARQSLAFPAGETSAEMVVLCPMDTAVGLINWSVSVNGVADPYLSQEPWSATGASQQFEGLRVVRPFADGQTPVRAVQRAPRRGQNSRRRIGPDLVDSGPLNDWLGYSAVDVLLLDSSRLNNLAEQHPERVQTIRRWMLAGGTVWVEGVDDSAKGYREVDRLLGVTGWRFQTVQSEREAEDAAKPTTDEPASEADSGTEENEIKSRIGRWRITPIEGAAGWGYQQIEARDGPKEPVPISSDRPRAQPTGDDTRGWYATRRVGFGRVLAFNRTHTTVPPRLRFGGQSDAVRRTWFELVWASRHGLEPGGTCPQFGNLLIPGVGVAPIAEFQVLITLFVLTIGPLNYWLLWRRQQLQMLVVTVPLCALAVTLALVGYAALSDGFGVAARARSVTLLDQTSGEAVSWSRVSHYVAMAPDEPATLPEDCSLYPIKPAWEASVTTSAGRRLTVWNGSEQTLASGCLPSRAPVQHLMVRCRESPARLAFSGEGDTTRVANQLGKPIDFLLARGADGDWRHAEAIEAGGLQSLEPISHSEAVKSYRLLALENEPTFPIGAGKAVEQTLERLGNSRAVRQLQRNFASVTLTDNLAEQMLGAISGLRGGRSLDLPPRSYLAVTSHAIETPLGWENVIESGSFHVLVGRW